VFLSLLNVPQHLLSSAKLCKAIVHRKYLANRISLLIFDKQNS